MSGLRHLSHYTQADFKIGQKTGVPTGNPQVILTQ